MNLSEILADQYQRASAAIIGREADDELIPMFCGYSETGLAVAMGVPLIADIKRDLIAEIGQMLRYHGCVAYSIAVETWVIKRTIKDHPKPMTIEEVRKLADSYTRPSQSSDRHEALMIYIEDVAGNVAGGFWEIKRNEIGTVCDLVAAEFSSKLGSFVSPTFTGLLRNKAKQH